MSAAPTSSSSSIPVAAARPSVVLRDTRPIDAPLRGAPALDRQDVRGFLSGSAVTLPLWHSSKPEYLRDIMEHGVDMSLNKRTSMGRGFYLSNIPLPRYGTPAQFALRTLNPLHLDYTTGWAGGAQAVLGMEALRGHHEFATPKLGQALMDAAQAGGETASYVRRGLLARGYDSIIAENVEKSPEGEEVDYYVALRGDNVRGIAGSELPSGKT